VLSSARCGNRSALMGMDASTSAMDFTDLECLMQIS